MDTFTDYLKRKGFAPATQRAYARYWEHFETWMQRRGLVAEHLHYEHLLAYMEERQGRGESKKSINLELLVVRHYFDWLAEQEITDYNPASNLAIRGVPRSVPKHLLERAALDALYISYPVKDARTHRNKVILGLLVYQALTREELERLEAKTFDLAKGLLHVTATSNRAKGRTLPLEAHQLPLLSQYLETVRPALLSVLGKPQVEYLFFGQQGEQPLGNVLSRLMGELRVINPKVKNANQLRLSVITDWLHSKDARVVQYLAGHRYVSSTERYQTEQLKALQQDLSKYHPLQ